MRRIIFIMLCTFGLFAENSEPKATQTTTSYVQNVEKKVITIDLKNAFNASPVIYSILLGLSLAAMTVALTTYFEISRKLTISQSTLDSAKEKIIICRYDEASDVLSKHTEAFAHMLQSVIDTRKYGLISMKEALKLSGKRETLPCWQKISILSDIAPSSSSSIALHLVQKQ